ncbi:hypothetical protein HUA74_25005 [Myxococcus sp. CA051A]|uniref:hypothetical protein n=1 Tax=Myxococcus sp. CA051A TaxID=2741739 RepID=UPI00157B6853|nr:hypothetical protein [Myxococcus sp. CA051A]NTX63924.1 hypothetical protein [Myxococcus sp. CA051A]
MPRALLRTLSPLLVLLMWSTGTLNSAAAPPATTTPSSPDLDVPSVQALEVLEQRILGLGCKPKLLGDANRRFSEAQLLCAAHLSFILVQLSLDGAHLPETPRRVKALLDDALTKGRGPFLSDGSARVEEHLLPHSVLYRGYVLLMLAGMERAGLADPASTALFDTLAEKLVEALSRQLLLPSFGKSIWPCDSAPAAAGLLLHGRLRGNAASLAMGERLTARLVELAALPSGFPTRVNAKGKLVESTPRGTALAWTGAFLAMGSHPAASTFTTTLVKGYCDRPGGDLLPFAACREWPRGVKGREDAASGPLLHGGYSVGASALAIAATRLSPEHRAWHQDLLNTAREMGIRPMLEKPHKHPLETALYWWGANARPW